jgi:hypothetical protein
VPRKGYQDTPGTDFALAYWDKRMKPKGTTQPAKIHIENDTDRPRIAWVEPWGEDYDPTPKGSRRLLRTCLALSNIRDAPKRRRKFVE